MKYKFKKGDIVRVVKRHPSGATSKTYLIGKKFSVEEVVDSFWPYTLVGVDDYDFAEEELEFDELYFSPLYEALK